MDTCESSTPLKRRDTSGGTKPMRVSATVVFYTVQAMGFDMRCEDDTEDGARMFQRDVQERVELSGTAKISFAAGVNEVSGVSLLTFDQRSAQLSETRYGMWW